jgi:hypothetical protein
MLWSMALAAQGGAWDAFARTKFSKKNFPEFGIEVLMPQFDWQMKLSAGKEVVLIGYYIPTDVQTGKTIMLSRLPNSSCFFCGGAGPETVARINFKGKIRPLKMDDVLKIKGVLRLNEKDPNEMFFILDEAEEIR